MHVVLAPVLLLNFGVKYEKWDTVLLSWGTIDKVVFCLLRRLEEFGVYLVYNIMSIFIYPDNGPNYLCPIGWRYHGKSSRWKRGSGETWIYRRNQLPLAISGDTLLYVTPILEINENHFIHYQWSNVITKSTNIITIAESINSYPIEIRTSIHHWSTVETDHHHLRPSSIHNMLPIWRRRSDIASLSSNLCI